MEKKEVEPDLFHHLGTWEMYETLFFKDTYLSEGPREDAWEGGGRAGIRVLRMSPSQMRWGLVQTGSECTTSSLHRRSGIKNGNREWEELCLETVFMGN